MKTPDLIYVLIQFVFFLLYFFAPSAHFHPGWMTWPALLFVTAGSLFITIALLQLNTRLSPFPTPVSNSRLLTGGAFKYSRHPIYFGILLLGLGLAVYIGEYTKLGMTFLLALLFHYKSAYEEKLLVKRFGKAYTDYQSKTRKFI